MISHRSNIFAGLYEQYIQRHVASEVNARTDSNLVRKYIPGPPTQDRPHTPSLRTSPAICAKSNATNTPPTHLSAPKGASSTSPMKSRQPSTLILGHTPCPRFSEPLLIPGYSVVHNHCSRITGDLDSDDPSIMQSYEYFPLEIGPAIGFQAPTTRRQVRFPPRKMTALESLPPLSPDIAAEIARRVKVREQTDILGAIRKAEAKESERYRRANRATQLKLPPCLAPIPASCRYLISTWDRRDPTLVVQISKHMFGGRLSLHHNDGGTRPC